VSPNGDFGENMKLYTSKTQWLLNGGPKILIKKILSAALIVMMVLATVPSFALAANGDVQNIVNKEVPVSWARSLNAENAIAVNDLNNFALAQIYTTPNVNMMTNWTLLNAIDANIWGEDADGNDLVWDGRNEAYHYTDIHLHGTYTNYPTATILGEGTTRFQGIFDLNDILDDVPTGTEIFNLKIGLDPYMTGKNQIALNDQMFVFLYPADVTLDDENFMDYYVFGAGFQWINQWVPEEAAGTVTFNGKDLVRTFRDFAYYEGGFEEAAAYTNYGGRLTELGYNGWEGNEAGWFGHGVSYRLFEDLENSRLTGIDHLYVSDGLFFHSFDEQLVVDLNQYGDDLPTDWIIDVFAVNTDAVGGLSKLKVFANYDQETFGSNGAFYVKKMVQAEDIQAKDIQAKDIQAKDVQAKDVQAKAGYKSGAGFVFDAWTGITSSGQPAGEFLGRRATDAAGIAAWDIQGLSSKNVPFVYLFEVGIGSEEDGVIVITKSIVDEYVFGAGNPGGYISVPVLNELPDNFEDNLFYNDLGRGSLIIGKAMGEKYSVKGSITGGYLYADEINGVIPAAKNGKLGHTDYRHSLSGKLGENGGNWFQFNEFTGTGGTFLLVQGDKLNVVGEYTITSDGGGWFTIQMSDALAAQGARVSISNTILAAKNTNDKAYNKNNIWTTSPGQQQFSGSGNSFRIYAPWVDVSQTVYVYLHLDGLSGYKGTNGEGPGKTFTVNVKGPSFPGGQDFQVPMNGFIELPNLLTGAYVIKETEKGYIPTYFVNGKEVKTGGFVTVTVKADKLTEVDLKNTPGEEEDVGSAIAFMKMAETEKGYAPGPQFKFNIYTEIDADGAPVLSSFAASVETDSDGIAFFESDECDAGTVFYVFEELTGTQSVIYVFGAQGAYLELVSVAVEDIGFDFDNLAVFYNDFASGALDVTLSGGLSEVYFTEYHDLIFKTGKSSNTLVSWVGYGANASPLPDGFTGYFLNNGMTYFEIDTAALRALEDGANIGIALSNKPGGNTINDRWNSPVGHDYNLKIVDDKLVVTCDFKNGSFGVLISDTAWAPGYNPTADIKHNNVSEYDLPAEDVIYFFFHSGGAEWYVQPLEVIGCELINRDGPFTRPYTGGMDVFDIIVTVTNADDEVVYAAPLGLVEGLKAGEYTVEITLNGVLLSTKPATVAPGETTELDFGQQVIPGLIRTGAPVIICDRCNP